MPGRANIVGLILLLMVLARCGAQPDETTGPPARPPAPSRTSLAAVDPPTTQPSRENLRESQKLCTDYAVRLEEVQRRLARLKKEGPPPPLDGYDFTEDYLQSMAIAESEISFYADQLNLQCTPESPYDPGEPPYGYSDYDIEPPYEPYEPEAAYWP